MSEQRTILNNAAVLDVVAGKLLPNHRVVVSAERIERVEPAGSSAEPADTVVLQNRRDMRGWKKSALLYQGMKIAAIFALKTLRFRFLGVVRRSHPRMVKIALGGIQSAGIGKRFCVS